VLLSLQLTVIVLGYSSCPALLNQVRRHVTKAEFQAALREVLAAHATKASRQIQLTLEHVPGNARALDLEVFTSQDADGAFDVRASLEGPDLYVLNRAIQSSALIFGVQVSETGFVPPVPMVDPAAVDFDVNDTIVDVVASWLKDVWHTLGTQAHGIPVCVLAHDGYGTVTPLKLRG
jgi:uncharacterized protein DUF6389